MEISPYSKNIIFYDTEFTDLNPRVGELLSVGLVKNTGEELYLELEHTGPAHPWVQQKVLPHLTGEKTTRTEARRLIREFIGDEKPYLVSYVNQFDAIYWYELFGSAQEHPAYWIPIDFASILFGCGYSPNSLGKHSFFQELELDKTSYREHNALDDARLLREVYRRFYERLDRIGK
ncbi:MAG: hypothetical protein UY92_C0006G0087 [Candidatus Magasanikbacteria bacterium GW2011_GWA2_56_11]|uniref:Uncharacterized protein n=1 Tax=Candidatus Magasanikbacteria bacterium GW2011_GWA2_56_11 TaxID=1619044 RepID=A0A0G1YH04_9BACT|nr:MAG: hypothetical protein UY92_C0006G0087 [Candidatus Magasanikbacteria bacterium GW2011_GWA2_56_11]